MSKLSDGSVHSVNVSYQVPAGGSCCGSGATNGHMAEVWVSNVGKTLMLDYCPSTGNSAQSFCC